MISEILNSDIMDRYVKTKLMKIKELDNYPDYLGLDQVREVLGGMGKRQAFDLILKGHIESSLVGRTRIIKKTDLLAYVEKFELTDEQKQHVEDVLRIHYEKLFADYPDVVTSETLEQMLNASENYIFRRLHDGRIKSLYIGRTYRIPKQCIIDYAISRDYQENKRRFPYFA